MAGMIEGRRVRWSRRHSDLYFWNGTYYEHLACENRSGMSNCTAPHGIDEDDMPEDAPVVEMEI